MQRSDTNQPPVTYPAVTLKCLQ